MSTPPLPHPGGARRGLEKWRAALVLGSFACLCNRKHSPQGPCQQIGEMQMGGEKAPRWHLDPVQMWLQPPGWSQHWQNASTDGWTKRGTGCENGWGQSGNLMQTKKMKEGEELPTKAFRQYKSQSNLLTANWAQECVPQRVLPLTTGWLLEIISYNYFRIARFFKGKYIRDVYVQMHTR